jgi:hypothetical protein
MAGRLFNHHVLLKNENRATSYEASDCHIGVIKDGSVLDEDPIQ